MPLFRQIVSSPVGPLTLIANDTGLAAILWPNDNPRRVRLHEPIQDAPHPILTQTAYQLAEYFAARRTTFSIPLDPHGTPFQQSVWQALLAIPFGETRTYAHIAQSLDNSRATRAVGAANGRNPLSIVVPCHRVIGASGKLIGFAGGLEAKAYLLRLEHSLPGLRPSPITSCDTLFSSAPKIPT